MDVEDAYDQAGAFYEEYMDHLELTDEERGYEQAIDLLANAFMEVDEEGGMDDPGEFIAELIDLFDDISHEEIMEIIEEFYDAS